MTPRRRPPITHLQAFAGTLAIFAGVAAVVAISYALLLPVEEVPPLPATQEVPADDVDRAPGEVVCPTARQINNRPVPIRVTSAELIECPALFNGRLVRYEGEAVGAVLLRADQAWLHLNDDRYALGIGPLSRHRTVVGGNSGMAVSVPPSVAREVTAGHARLHGTRLEVIGMFDRADATDGGSPSIRAAEVVITDEAEAFTTPVARRRVVAAAVLTVATLALLVRLRVVRRRR